MNYYQVDMKDPGKYGIENPERVTFVDMILDADGETSAYIFEDIPEAKLSWFGVHDFSNIDSFRFLMLAKAEGNCDGQWQIAMRTPVRIDIGDVVNLVSPATYEIDNTVDDLVLEFSIPEKSNVYRNYTVECFPVDPDDGKIFHKAAMNVGDEKIVIQRGRNETFVLMREDYLAPDEDLKRAVSAQELLVGIEADVRKAFSRHEHRRW